MLLTVALSAAIAAAVERQRFADGCTPAQTRTAVAHADVQRLGSLADNPVVLVALESSCMCGTVNCPWLVLRLGGTPAVPLSAYAFGVARGQRLTIGSVGSRAKLTLTLFDPADAPPLEVHAGVPIALDRSGIFTLHVENDRDQETPYVFTLSIR